MGRARVEVLVQSLSERVGRHLERRGLLERDAENGYLALEPQGEDALADGRPSVPALEPQPPGPGRRQLPKPKGSFEPEPAVTAVGRIRPSPPAPEEPGL